MSPHIVRVELDQARLLPHLRDTARLERAQAAVFVAEYERASAAGVATSKVVPFAPDPQDLRGIPVVGRGVGGVSPGTHPERAALSRAA